MKLESIIHSQGAELRQLHAAISGRSWEEALPSTFPDKVLLELARDFRDAEARVDQSKADVDIASPLLAVITLLKAHPDRIDAKKALPEVSEETTQNVLEAYQCALEREIFSRIVGSGTKQDSIFLRTALWDAAVGNA